MTVTTKLVLKRKLKSATENIQMGSRKKPTRDLLIVADNNLITTSNDNPRKASFDTHTFADSEAQLSFRSRNSQISSDHKRTAGMTVQQHLDDGNDLDNDNILVDEKCKQTLRTTVYGCRSIRMLDYQKKKEQGMDAGRLGQCAGILKKLMTHQYGWVFNQPVDPVKLGIPDYFSIITKPMDLGTVKHKLESMRYMNTTEFFEDVKLTFDNAMRYNPPSNSVHIMANKLRNIFTSCWKSLEARYEEQDLRTFQKKTNKKNPSSRQRVREKASNHPNSCSGRTLASLESPDVKVTCGRDRAQCLQKDLERSSRMQTNSTSSCDIIYKSSVAGLQEVFSDGAISTIDDENADLTTPPATSGNGYECYEEQLSPSKALRAAVLKSRFADTIFKAQNKTLLNHGEKGDLRKMQQEQAKHEKKQQEEKANIQAKIEAAKAAVRMKEEADMKLQREREREAARLAVQRMEKTVDIDENFGLQRDLQSIGAKQAETFDDMVINIMDVFELPGIGSPNPLEQLGLFFKNEDMDEEIEEWISAADDGSIEEGEIGFT